MNLQDLENITPTALGPEIERRRTSQDPPRPVPDPHRLGRRITAGVVAFAVFGLAVALGAGVITDRAAPQPVTEGWTGYGEGWTELPAPPAWRDGSSIVWTGAELLYWGGTLRGKDGSHAASDGFAFDPASQTWSSMPSAPHAGLRADAVWTGTEALFVSLDQDRTRAQAFDPSTASWRVLPSGPSVPEYGVSTVWTGDAFVLFGGGPVGAPTNHQAWALDPRSGDWRRLPDAPIGMNLSDAVWTGDEVAVIGSALDNRNSATSRTSLAEVYDPSTDRWQELPAPPISAQTAAAASIDGRLIGWELYGPESAEWLPEEHRWRSLEMGGFEGGECYADGTAVSDTLFTWNCGSPAAWFAQTGAWVPIDRPIEPDPGFDYSFGWTSPAGDAAVVEEIETIAGQHGEPYVGSSDAPEHLWLWKPPLAAPASTWVPRRTDATDLVGSFLSNWSPGWQPYLPALATGDVIERCRSGAGGLVSLENGAIPNWGDRSAIEIANGTFDVTFELIRDHQIVGTEVFTVGPGTAADGRVGQLVITDVRPA